MNNISIYGILTRDKLIKHHFFFFFFLIFAIWCLP